MQENKNNFKSNDCVAINVKELGKSGAFYRDILGFKLIEEKEDQLVFDTGHFKLFVDKGEASHPPVPSFSVDDIELAKKRLTENGCKIVRGGKSWFWFEDPFGMVFDVIQK